MLRRFSGCAQVACSTYRIPERVNADNCQTFEDPQRAGMPGDAAAKVFRCSRDRGPRCGGRSQLAAEFVIQRRVRRC